MFVCFMAVSLVVFWTKAYQMVVFILVSICYIESSLHHSHDDLIDVTVEISNMPKLIVHFMTYVVFLGCTCILWLTSSTG